MAKLWAAKAYQNLRSNANKVWHMKLLHLKHWSLQTHSIYNQNIQAFKRVQFKYSKSRYDCKTACRYALLKYVAVQARKDEKKEGM
jgi:hypothetical protein